MAEAGYIDHGFFIIEVMGKKHNTFFAIGEKAEHFLLKNSNFVS